MKSLFLLICCFLLASCGGQGWAERAANDRIMMVRVEPPTLGYHRLVQESARHPDLGVFLRKQGRPDFVAETHSDDRHYMILFYLEKKRAFAARSWRGQSVIEFAGPSPITAHEVKLLGDLKKNSVQETQSGIASGRLLVP
jgi:hypothetical protein